MVLSLSFSHILYFDSNTALVRNIGKRREPTSINTPNGHADESERVALLSDETNNSPAEPASFRNKILGFSAAIVLGYLYIYS